jgi:hypothetical protein
MAKPKKGSVINPVNPLWVIAGKQAIPQDDIDDIHMEALIALDAAKRGQATGYLANKLRDHVMTYVVLWRNKGNRTLYLNAVEAWNQLVKAFQRPTDLLDLTTGEYQAIRRSMSYYLRAMPKIEIGVLTASFLEAQRVIKESM